MFRVEDIKELLWPVEINVPRNDGSGESDPHQIKVRYRYLPTDDYQKALDTVLNSKTGNRDFRDYVLGWEDVADANGKPMPFNKANLKRVMSHRWIAQAINTGFRHCQDAGLIKN